jgi:hypothetical protein
MSTKAARRYVIGAAIFNAAVVALMSINWFTLVNAFSCGACISAAIGLTYLMQMETALMLMTSALRSMGELQNGIVQAWAAEDERRETPTVH